MIKDLTAQDLMTEKVISIQPDDTLKSAMILMKKHHIRHIPVTNLSNELLGLISHRDILAISISSIVEIDKRILSEVYSELKIKNIMKQNLFYALKKNPLSEMIEVMVKNKIGCLPVIDKDKTLLGIFTETDVAKYLYTVITG